MAVNVGLMPTKGMTLPFISSAAPRCWRWAMTLGMLLALDPAAARRGAPEKATVLPSVGGLQPTVRRE